MTQRGLPVVRVRSGATNATHFTNFNTWSIAAFTQLTAFQLLTNQLLVTATTVPGLLSSADMSHLLLGKITPVTPGYYSTYLPSTHLHPC